MIGDILKKTRLIFGYKAKEMSKLIEISPSYLSEIENNSKKPSLELLEKYSNVFGIKPSSLLLLAEDYEEKNNQGFGEHFVRRRMIHLIDKMSERQTDEQGLQEIQY